MKLEIISKCPAGEQHPTPLLFIHGTLHTAACWDVHFLDYFAQHGYAAHAVNLRGHGKSEGWEKLHWTRIADFVEDGANTVWQLPSPPILIGHSMGGFITQKYLEDHEAPAAVLLSSASPAGLLPTAIRTARRRPWVFAKVNLTLSLLPFIATPQLVGEAFFSKDLPEEQLLDYWKQTQDDSFRAFLDMVALDLPKPEKVKTPLLVLGAARDNMIGPREIEATARAYNTQADSCCCLAPALTTVTRSLPREAFGDGRPASPNAGTSGAASRHAARMPRHGISDWAAIEQERQVG
jgi:pimeloyl-ACP methyl ester carboxylesterase